jgi:hypothetical protein
MQNRADKGQTSCPFLTRQYTLYYFFLAQDYNDWAKKHAGGGGATQDLVYYTIP